MIVRKNRDLFLLSLRVLSHVVEGKTPAASEVQALRQHTLPGEAALPVDEMCCALIRRELGHSEIIEVTV